ncbi:lysophosphatidylserine lipase ABHD12 isoform X1 [Drosophila subobscura]|uniref:lysophosphatidylserine lipase ABHD12 isoform X1 n=1 Tax=Drosophila subobscura TaxID=7241 RepID=UPI00155B29D4|nr:lysophosphatidylserine lipase ABHD12 isoform X1 [Drosophila subobscura]XP_034654232.1 lysophosphatidylserine lipase ABHD12 isoform X1 [Drosophila subobscura]
MSGLHSTINTICYATIIPGTIFISWLIGLVGLRCLQVCLLFFILILVVLPLVFRYSVTLQRGILFLTFITYPKGLDLTNPAGIGLYATRNFYITVKENDEDEDGVRIGVWHVLPRNAVRRFKRELQVEEAFDQDITLDERRDDDYEQELRLLAPAIKSEFPSIVPENEQLFYERLLRMPGGTVVIYLHGNTATRGSGHRSEVYKLLRNLNYHVLSFDYRGYADSDPVSPTEEGVVRDAMMVYEYIANVTSNPVIIWGHSLGTGVATHMCARLAHLKERAPRGVILESPFTNIRDEIRLHPFSRIFKHLPWFDFAISRPMYSNRLRFESDIHVHEFPQPIMIIHAEDDVVVPFHLGYQLYRIALDSRSRAWGPVEFHRFDRSKRYGHKYLCRAPELPGLIQHFVENYRKAVY